MAIFTDAKAGTGLTTEVLRYHSIRREHIQAIEAQDATSPCHCVIGVFQAKSDQGLVLKQANTRTPGGQVNWSGDLWLEADEEVQARFNYTTSADKLFLTVKTARVPSEVRP